VGAVVALVEREGSDAWYAYTAQEVLPEGYVCPSCGADKAQLRKETDVLDVWFDSGSTNRAVLEDNVTWKDLVYPADVYLEGGDQHRGWFNPATDSVTESEMLELDRWMLNQMRRLVQNVTAAYDVYEFHKVYVAVHTFCAVELSAFYLDVIKDRLYASKADSLERRSAQTLLHTLAETLARLLAPILVHTADEAWDYLKTENKAESVHLADFPAQEALDEALLSRWEGFLALREAVKKALEEARQAGQIGNPLESCVEVSAEEDTLALLGSFGASLSTLLLVSQVVLKESSDGLKVEVRPADGVKCARCWLVRTDTGTNPEHPQLCARCTQAIA